MKVELNENEINFIQECISMAAREGFYMLSWHKANYDSDEVGAALLRKLGFAGNVIDDCISRV